MLRTALISLMSTLPTLSAVRLSSVEARLPTEHSVGSQEAERQRFKHEVPAIDLFPRTSKRCTKQEGSTTILDFGFPGSPPFKTPSKPADISGQRARVSASPDTVNEFPVMVNEHDSSSANSTPTSKKAGELKDGIDTSTKTHSSAEKKVTTQHMLYEEHKNPHKAQKKGDRFIPRRMSQEQLDVANFMLTSKAADSLTHIVKGEEGQDADGNNPIAQQEDPSYRQLLAKWMLNTEGDASGWRLRGGGTSAGGSSRQQSSRILTFSGDDNRNRMTGAQTASNLAMQRLSDNVLHMRQVYRENKAGLSSGRKTGEFFGGMILDAPAFVDDYYLNVLDWSSLNVIAVALWDSVFLWDAANATIVHLFDGNLLEPWDRQIGPPTYVASVRFSPNGKFLAIGISNGNLHIYNVATRVRTRRILNNQMMAGTAQRLATSQGARIAAIDWRDNAFLSCGNKVGVIFNIDLRPNAAIPASIYIEGHTGEICALAWQPERDNWFLAENDTVRFLAAGSNDNNVTIWDPTFRRETNPVPDARTQLHPDGSPVYPGHRIRISPMVQIGVYDIVNRKFRPHAHIAAVKALAWCPQNPDLLASGSGTADGTIKLWHVSQSLRSTDFSTANGMAPRFTQHTGAQVSGIVWSLADAGKFISSHGFPSPSSIQTQNLSAHHLQIWEVNLKNPNKATFVEKVTDQRQGHAGQGHTGRILGLRPNPTGDIVVSGAADETLRLWNVFNKSDGRLYDPRKEEMCEMDRFGNCIH